MKLRTSKTKFGLYAHNLARLAAIVMVYLGGANILVHNYVSCCTFGDFTTYAGVYSM